MVTVTVTVAVVVIVTVAVAVVVTFAVINTVSVIVIVKVVLCVQVVGDIVTLNAGDKVPADGVLIDGSDLSANESALTGESDDKNKSRNPVDQGGDMFMLSGSSISTGYCVMLVTAVGEQSRWGRTKAKLAAEAVDTPLQEKLDVLAGQIGNLGMAAAVATFIAMLTIWWYYPATREEGVTLFEYALKAFIMAVTIVVVAVPEGLPLAVTLSLAYSTQKMMKDNNLIRVLAACETMGNATNICSDKTGTLTQNRMTVVEGFFAGKYYKPTPVGSQLQQEFVQLMAEGISLNSTANLMKPQNAGEMPIVTGNKTEGALLLMLKSNFSIDYVPLRSQFNSARGDRLITFSSARKRMSVVLVNAANRGGICYTKGAAEIILGLCTHYIDQNGVTKVLDNDTHKTVTEVISNMAKNALRAVALAHRHIKSVTGKEDPEELESGLCLDCVFGIKDPLRPDVIEAVKACQEAGVFVRMVTGDNIETAKAIAKECGILTKGGIAMEGPHFRKLTPQQLDAVLPNLQVLARSSPDDKHTLVTRLNGRGLPTDKESWLLAHPDCNYEKQKDLLLPGYLEEWQAARAASGGVGEVVGVTGDGTNDGPALKIADVGLSMGLSGTDGKKYLQNILVTIHNYSYHEYQNRCKACEDISCASFSNCVGNKESCAKQTHSVR